MLNAYEMGGQHMAVCGVCWRHCRLDEGQTGFCNARINRKGTITGLYYGAVSSLALDPIEKKPLRRFHPGGRILSIGSLGCNLRCPFCQNHEIAQPDRNRTFSVQTEYVSPERIAETAERCREMGNLGAAFTYNEPLVGYEFVRDTARLVHDRGMLNVLVTNGTASREVFDEVIPYVDAMNIDLKGFTDRYYSSVLQGDRHMVMDFIQLAVQRCHVELTTLIIPGENDSDEEIRQLSEWIAGLSNVFGGKKGYDIPLHISRFFPQYHMTDRGPTDVGRIYHLADVARENLRDVFTGNC